MKWLVDATVLSEPTKRQPNEAVLDWLRAQESDIAVSAVILAEFRLGIVALPIGARRRRLDDWYERLSRAIRCLPWDSATSRVWADLVISGRDRGRPMPIMDSLIAACALQHNLVLVTRNARDFKGSGVRLHDPFAA